MKTKQMWTIETIIVYPVDTERVAADYAKKVQAPDTVSYHCHPVALIKKPSLSLIDEDFVGYDIKDNIRLDIYKETRLDENRWSGSCFPDVVMDLSTIEIGPYLKPAITLAEYTKDRRGYNSRIIGNEAAWLRHFNH